MLTLVILNRTALVPDLNHSCINRALSGDVLINQSSTVQFGTPLVNPCKVTMSSGRGLLPRKSQTAPPIVMQRTTASRNDRRFIVHYDRSGRSLLCRAAKSLGRSWHLLPGCH